MPKSANKRKKVLIQCRSLVDRNAVTRTSINGVEHIIVRSHTLPDNVVMNGGLYPAEEIERSFDTLERTLAPVEHPQDSDGNFISANDPIAIHNFHAGAFNQNVKRENGRVTLDKVINVQEASKSDRGKRLLDRINELENSDDPRPIHTSTGVFLEVEELDGPRTNDDGQEYTWIARDMFFDHDAILLDSVAAAQPHQGVGMAINGANDDIQVHRFVLNDVKAAKGLPLADTDATWDKSAADKRVREKIGAEDSPNATYARYHLWVDADNADEFGSYKLPFVDIIDGRAMAVPSALRNAAARLNQTQGPSAAEKEDIRAIIDNYLDRIRNNQDIITVPTEGIEDLSHDELRQKLFDAVNKPPLKADWVIEVYDNRVIYAFDDQFFEVPYTVGNGVITITGMPVPVERNVTFVPKTNQKGDAMRELMLKALADAGVTVNSEISDDDLLAKYNELQTNQSSDDGSDSSDDSTKITEAVTNALKPLTEKVTSLETKLNQKDNDELDKLADLIGNSDKYPGIDADAAKKLGVDTLKTMAANCVPAHGVPLTVVNGGKNDNEPYEMPK